MYKSLFWLGSFSLATALSPVLTTSLSTESNNIELLTNSSTTNNQEIKLPVQATSAIQGLSSKPKNINLVTNYMESIKRTIAGQPNTVKVNLVDTNITLINSKVDPLVLKDLNDLINQLITKNGTIVSENYQTVNQKDGNYQAEINLRYKTNESQGAQSLQVILGKFNEVNLESGGWSLKGNLSFELININHVDNTFNSKIVLPQQSFFFNCHQIMSFLSLDKQYQTNIEAYINSQTKVNLNSYVINGLYNTQLNNDKTFKVGTQIDFSDLVQNSYFYASISAPEVADGIFYLLVQNIAL